jgi:hypothetical protein
VDLRAPLRQADGEKALDGAIDLAMARKPRAMTSSSIGAALRRRSHAI